MQKRLAFADKVHFSINNNLLKNKFAKLKNIYRAASVKQLVCKIKGSVSKKNIRDIKSHIVEELLQEMSPENNDRKYKKYFISHTGRELYTLHIQSNFICCAFCCHLTRSSCHNYCFSCKKNCYGECGPLLPGSFPFTGENIEKVEVEKIPWVFKIPCTSFERLRSHNYFRNFNSFSPTIAVTNFEVIEGIFTGLSRGKKPCHLCASVDLEIFNNCSNSSKAHGDEACSHVLDEISNKYNTLWGMVKYNE